MKMSALQYFIIPETVTAACGKLVTTRKISRPVMISQMSVDMNIHQDWLTGMALNVTTGDLCVTVASIKQNRNRLIIFNNGRKKTSFAIEQTTGASYSRRVHFPNTVKNIDSFSELATL